MSLHVQEQGPNSKRSRHIRCERGAVQHRLEYFVNEHSQYLGIVHTSRPVQRAST